MSRSSSTISTRRAEAVTRSRARSRGPAGRDVLVYRHAVLPRALGRVERLVGRPDELFGRGGHVLGQGSDAEAGGDAAAVREGPGGEYVADAVGVEARAALAGLDQEHRELVAA